MPPPPPPPPPPPLPKISKKPPGQEDKRLFCLFPQNECHAPFTSLPLVRCVHKHYTLARVHGKTVADWLVLLVNYVFVIQVGVKQKGAYPAVYRPVSVDDDVPVCEGGVGAAGQRKSSLNVSTANCAFIFLHIKR